MKAQKRNRDVIENFICECFVTVRGVLCQGRDSEPPPIGERLVIEVEESSYGVSLVLLKSSTGAFVVNDWLGRNLMVFTSFLFFNTFV